MSAQVIDVIAGVIATTRHPKTGELMVGRGAKKRAAAILAALNAAGFVVVPKEPLPELVAAWWRVKNGAEGNDTSDYAAYRAMIAAATEAQP